MKLLSNILNATVDKTITALGDTLDKLFTSDEEKIKAEALLTEIKGNLKLKLVEQAIQYDTEVTKRWLSDNEHPLTRLVRPSIVAWSYVLFTGVMLADGNFYGFKLNPAYVPVLQTIIVTVTTAYFGSRGIEKVSKYFTSKGSGNE